MIDQALEPLRNLFATLEQERDQAQQSLVQERKRFDEERQQLRGEISRLHEQMQVQSQRMATTGQSAQECDTLRQECQRLQAELDSVTRQLEQDRAATAKQLAEWDAWGEEMTRRLDEAQLAGQQPAPQLVETAAPAIPAGHTPASGQEQTAPVGGASARPRAEHDSRRILTPGRVVMLRGVNDEVEGWVVERHPEGIALLVDDPLPAGINIKVRSAKSAAAKWIEVTVESCGPERSSYRLTCSFPKPVSWPELQQLS